MSVSLQEFLIGNEALQILHTGENHDLSMPMDRGVVTDWDAMEKIFEYIYKELNVDSGQYPVLITNSPLNAPENRAQLAHRMFNTFHASGLCIHNQAVLSLFATGRTTGLVLEAGDGITNSVPVFEGHALQHAVLQLNLAGRDLTR